MAAWLAWVSFVVTTAGTVLPQVWPHLVHMAEDAAKIIAILTENAIFGAKPTIATVEDGTDTKLSEDLIKQGFDPDEVSQVVSPTAR